MSFDLPERSPLDTLSILDLSSSQVTWSHGSWFLQSHLEQSLAQRREGFRGRAGPHGVFGTEQPVGLQWRLQHHPKIQAPILSKPCTLSPSPSPAAEWDDWSLWDTVWLRRSQG